MIRRVLVLLILFGFVAPSEARAEGWLQFFFPMLKYEKNDPSQTLEAPFADEEAIGNEAGKPVVIADSVPLELPHRNTGQIAAWLVGSVAESLTFEKIDPQDDYDEVRKYFDERGWIQYQDFITENRIDDILAKRQYMMQSFVEGQPLEINEAAMNGSYKWLFEVPVMISYFPKGQNGYKSGSEDPVTQNVVLKIQVGRGVDTGTEHNLLIESWTGRVIKSSQSEL